MLKRKVKMRESVKRNRLNYREEKALTPVGAFFVTQIANTVPGFNQKGVNMLRFTPKYILDLNRKSNIKTFTGIFQTLTLWNQQQINNTKGW